MTLYAPLLGHTESVNCLCVDGTAFLYSAGADCHVQEWDLRSGTPTRQLAPCKGTISALQLVLLKKRVSVKKCAAFVLMVLSSHERGTGDVFPQVPACMQPCASTLY